MNALVPLMAGIPLLAATVLAVAGLAMGRRAADALALVAAAATTVVCLIVLVRTGQGLHVHWFGGWHPRHGVAIGVDFAVDGLGAGLAAFVALLMTLAMVYTWKPVEADAPHFQVLMLVFLGAMVGFSVSGDLFDLFVFFELMSVTAFALVGYQSDSRGALQGALNFAVTNTLGSFVFLAGIALIYGRTGALNLAQIGQALGHHPTDGLVLVSFGLICVGFFVKAAVVPFHFWLADAYAVAPASVLLLLAGAMSEMGLFGVGRVFFTAYHAAFGSHEDVLRAILVGLGVLTSLWGAGMALAQDHLKRMLAFITISYVGVFLCGLGLLTADGVAGAAIYIVADGFGKAGLFATMGIVQHRTGHLTRHRLQGAARHLRATGAVWFALALVTATLPPFGAFLGKSAVDDAALKAGYDFLPTILAIVVALNAGALLRAGARMFLGWGDIATSEQSPDDEPAPETEGGEADRTPFSMFLPAALLLACEIGVGVWFGFADLVGAAAHRFVGQAAYAAHVLGGKSAPVPSPPSHAPEWFDWLYATGGLVGALAVAALGLWARRLGAPGRRMAETSGRLLRPLEELHSGHIGDYAAWLVLGAGAFTALLALAR